MVKKQLVVTLLKYGLGIGLLALVVWQYWDATDLPSGEHRPGLAEALQKPIDYQPLALAAVAFLLGVLITFYRWYILVRAQDLPFTVASAMRLGMVGFYLSTFLPGSVGGDIIKAAFIAREQRRRAVAVATVIVDRVMGLCGLFCLVALVGGVAWLGGYMDKTAVDESAAGYLEMIVLAAIGLTAGSLVVWFFAGFVSDTHSEQVANFFGRVPKIGGHLAELWRALHMYRQRWQTVAQALALSVVGHVGFVLSFYFAAQALTPQYQIPTLAAHFVIVPVGMTFAAGFPSPGGVGGSEFGYGALYRLVGFAFTAGVLGSLTQRVITWVLGLLGYLIYLRMKPALRAVPVEQVAAAEQELQLPHDDVMPSASPR